MDAQLGERPVVDEQVEPLARGELLLRVLARDPLLAAAELGLGAALVQVLDEGSQHRGGNIPAVPRFGAIIFDLLTALLDSWTLWGDVAGDDELGARRRRRSLELIYASGAYRPYREIVAEAARRAASRDELLGGGTSSSRGRRRPRCCATWRPTTGSRW